MSLTKYLQKEYMNYIEKSVVALYQRSMSANDEDIKRFKNDYPDSIEKLPEYQSLAIDFLKNKEADLKSSFFDSAKRTGSRVRQLYYERLINKTGSVKNEEVIKQKKEAITWIVNELKKFKAESNQQKKRDRISNEEKRFLEIKDRIGNPKSFGKFRVALSARGLDYSDSTYSRLWNKYYSG